MESGQESVKTVTTPVEEDSAPANVEIITGYGNSAICDGYFGGRWESGDSSGVVLTHRLTQIDRACRPTHNVPMHKPLKLTARVGSPKLSVAACTQSYPRVCKPTQTGRTSKPFIMFAHTGLPQIVHACSTPKFSQYVASRSCSHGHATL